MAYEIELDSQGRIVVPARFRQYAGLENEAMVIGTRDRFEVWSTANWQAYTDEMAALDLRGLPLPF
jgi:MraZ protein